MRFKYILFDLDGTLIDTNQLIIDSFRHTYREHLNREVEDHEILKHFGEPLITTLKRYSEEKAEDMYTTYIKYNECNHDKCVTLCLEIEPCLKALKDMGCELAVVTAKRHKTAHRGLELFDIKKYFTTVVTLDDTEKHKPHPEPIYKALEMLGGNFDEALMVGDSVFDIQCAHNAGIKAALVSWGAAIGHIQAEKPDYNVDMPNEIVEIARG